MEDRLERFLSWSKENGIVFRGCTIKPSSNGGYGVFSGEESVGDVLMTTPLALSLTPMTVVEDPILGSQYREMRQNDVDDRLLVMIFLIIERARGKSSFWAPYLEILPSEFGTPLWFDDEELMQLDGTTLFQATKAQLRSLTKLFDKVKMFSEKALASIGLENELQFKDFLWANCVFWTRALNIPWPASFLAPERNESTSNVGTETIWVEGLVPGIDFCNHARKSSALWEVDGKDGSTSGVPHSMYLFLAGPDVVFPPETEILINYGDKGNEELLFLYGFVEDNNPNDYVMIHFPKELMEQDASIDYKLQMLQEMELSTRWLLPGSLLDNEETSAEPCNQSTIGFSWSGVRKAPLYLKSLIFPQEMIAALRVLAMSEADLQSVALLLQELVRVPSKDDIQAAVWEVCGDSHAFRLLLEILSAKIDELLRGTGSELADEEILQRDRQQQAEADVSSQNHRASVIYRKGQKRLVSGFINKARLLLSASVA